MVSTHRLSRCLSLTGAESSMQATKAGILLGAREVLRHVAGWAPGRVSVPARALRACGPAAGASVRLTRGNLPNGASRCRAGSNRPRELPVWAATRWSGKLSGHVCVLILWTRQT